MILKNFMIHAPITVHPDDSVHRAVQIMAWAEIHHLPVTVADKKVVGVLSERDVLSFRASRPDLDLKATAVAEVMRESPQTAAPDSHLTEAAARFAQHQLGCLPVTEKGKLVGLVTRTDVLAAEVESSMQSRRTELTTADVMTSDPETIRPDDELSDAVQLMFEIGVRHLPVVDEQGRTIGLLADHDVQGVMRAHGRFSNWISEDATDGPLRVRDLMSKRPLHVSPEDSCVTVAGLFVQFRTSAALVTTADKTLVGIVSYVDLLKSIQPQFESRSARSNVDTTMDGESIH